jgi:hypothetical protein
MKNKLLLTAIIGFSICAVNADAQRTAGKKTSGPYTLRNSDEFESPKGHELQSPLAFADGVLQLNTDGIESFNFQWFSNDLKLVKENTVAVRDKFNDKVSFWTVLRTRNKVYVLTREVFKETETEGITAIEIAPKEMNVKGTAKNLFKSSGKVRSEGSGYGVIYIGNFATTLYDLYESDDSTKFLCTYALAPKEKNDKKNNDVIGLQIFDENMAKVWGEEVEMPYTEAKMDNLGYTLTNDGRVCLLAKVYEGDSQKDGAKNKEKPNYHFEVIVYEKGGKAPKKIEIKLDNYFNKEAYIYVGNDSKITLAGFYGKKQGSGVDGSYLLSLDIDKSTITKINGGYYELPTKFLESFMSDRQKKKAEEKMDEDEGYDLELNNLDINAIYVTPDGSTKIVAEIFYVIVHRTSNGGTTYTYVYKDVVVMNIKGGKLDWVQKIPKYQSSATGGRGCSISSMIIGNDLHVFWKDKPENSMRAASEKPARFGGTNGMLRGCSFNAKGEMKMFDIVDVAPYDMHFDIKHFSSGYRNSLLNTERRSKVNMLFSLDVKP